MGRTHCSLSFSITALQHSIQWMRYSLATQTFPDRSGLWGVAIFVLGEKKNQETQNIFNYFFWRRRKLKYTSVCIFCVHQLYRKTDHRQMENLGGETSISHSVHILIGQINSWLLSLAFLHFSAKTTAVVSAYCKWIQHLHRYNYSNPPIWNELLQRESSMGSAPRIYNNTNT